MESKAVFSGQHLAKSMRSSGYKNTAYALAEIIDNAVEAKAKHIEILCSSKPDYSSNKNSKQFEMIAIADDGEGMTVDELWSALVMGEGTRYAATGIGKFGMGLPNSSMSQCKTVTVYSWKKSDQVYSTVLDLNNVDDGLAINFPQKTEIPKIWKNNSKFLKNSKSGTLVVWSNLDKIQWKRASTLLTNSERLVGRIYRKFIHNNKLEIRFLAFDSETKELSVDKIMLPNDPLYQMIPSSTPEPWDKKPMFIPDGEKLESIIKVNGYDVKIRCTLAIKEARQLKENSPAGRQPHGKHANSNLGISVIRADRELYLDTNLCQTYDPLERWWGVEVEFPNELDDVFGVTNNKQDVTNFSAMTHIIGAISRNEEDDDERDYDTEDYVLRELVIEINRRIQSMRRSIKNMNVKNTRGEDKSKHFPPDSDDTPKVTDKQEKQTDEEKLVAITEKLSKTSDPQGASEEAKQILDDKIKTVIKEASLGSSYFFDVHFEGGIIIITLNTDHPAYDYLVKPLKEIPDLTQPEQIKQFVSKASTALNLLLVSWAYYENHIPNEEERRKLDHIRYEWGRQFQKIVESLKD